MSNTLNIGTYQYSDKNLDDPLFPEELSLMMVLIRVVVVQT
jgi:hypothetical protein